MGATAALRTAVLAPCALSETASRSVLEPATVPESRSAAGNAISSHREYSPVFSNRSVVRRPRRHCIRLRSDGRKRLKNEPCVVLDQRPELCSRRSDHAADHDDNGALDAQLRTGSTESKPNRCTERGSTCHDNADLVPALRSGSSG